MSEPNKAVFLSYASQDAEAVARLAAALRAAGVEVWFDQNELVGGDAWDAKIRRQIKECALFVPVISANTQARGEGYFRLEWKLGEDRSHLMAKSIPFIVPVTIDRTTEREAMVPDAFLAVQWTRLDRGAVSAAFVAHIQQLLAGSGNRPPGGISSSTTAAKPVPATAADVVRPRHRARAWTMGMVLLIAALVGAWFVAQRKPEPVPRSVAVLPFVNLGADKGDEYLGDGMAEEVINLLAQLPGLRVAGRTSSFAFKGRADEDILRKVGSQLNVGTVLDGSVRKAGEKLRITAVLINVADGFQLWSETYDRDFSDILTIQREVAQRVVQVLQVKLGVAEAQTLAKRPTENAEAHRLYLLGRHRFLAGTQADLASAQQIFQQVIALDPGYVLAYCGMADTYGWIGNAVMPGHEAWAKEIEWAQKALALDPLLPDAHLSLGLGLAGAFDFRGGEKAMLRALELNPNLGFAHNQLGWLYWVLGRLPEADARMRKSLEHDPLNPIFNTDLAAVAYFTRRYDEGIAQLRRTLELHPTFASAHLVLGWCKRGQSDLVGAAAAFARAYEIDAVPLFAGSMAGALAAAGDRAKADTWRLRLTELAERRYVSPSAFALLHLGLGNHEQALDWLERCYQEQDGLCWNFKVDPVYDPVRRHPRFQALLKKLGLD